MQTMQTTSTNCNLPADQQHFRKSSTTLAPAPHRCPEPGCTRAFNRKYTLAEHQKTHTGDKPYVCPVRSCSKRFTTTGNLSRHRRLHGPVLPLQCSAPGCICTFSSETKLAKHMKFHIGTAEHVCGVPGCGRTFSTVGNHNRHMRNQHSIYHDIDDSVSAALFQSPVKRARATAATGVDSAAGDSDAGAQSPSGADDNAWLFGWVDRDDDIEDDTETTAIITNIDMAGIDTLLDTAWLETCIATTEPLTVDEASAPWETETLDALSLLLQADVEDSE